MTLLIKIGMSPLRYIVAGFTIACLLAVAPHLAAQDTCKVMEKLVADASSKVHSTPTHIYTTSKVGGQTFASEIIYAAGSMYMKIDGKWSLAGSIKDLEQTEQQLKRDAHSRDVCRSLKDETVNGELASVYTSHSETPKGTIDSQVWISKTKGLPLREVTTSDDCKATISTRYEYGNVRLPDVR
jgi:hypothetical protein